MKEQLLIRSLETVDDAAREFISRVGDDSLVAFYAPMGAGKTTFTCAICRVLGVTDPVCSPTFTIINEYRRADGRPMYHFDFYRINRLAEAADIGLEDYLYSGCLCLMEWPENVEPLLPEETVRVSIEVLPDGSRLLSWDRN